MVNPLSIEMQTQGAIVYALTAALYGEITVKDGAAEQSNFDGYEMLRLAEAPRVETVMVPGGDFWGGVGEPPVPPLAPALCNAIFAATGKRIRSLPLKQPRSRRHHLAELRKRSAMRACLSSAMAVLAVLSALSRAFADENPGDCLGVDFNIAHPVTIARIIADQPRVSFIKSAWQDAACPADGDACTADAYLVPGDLVLVGKSRRPLYLRILSIRRRSQATLDRWLATLRAA